MSKIVFEYEDEEYILELDRRTCEMGERSMGLSIGDLTAGKLTLLPGLFQVALVKHHPKLKPSKVKELYDSMTDKQGLYEALYVMYAECVDTLLDEPEEGKATGWKVV